MDTNKNHYIVFTDMDGTLLDHYDYSFAAAEPLLQKLKQQQIPVIANTSKTFAEMKLLCRQLSLDTPFIVENGAAVYIPKTYLQKNTTGQQALFQELTSDLSDADDYYYKTLVEDKARWVLLLKNISADLETENPASPKLFEHYAVMSTERLQELTGLSKEKAEQSKQRQFSEPVVWHGSDQQKRDFIEKLKSHGASPLEGGRFIHVMGSTNKGIALQWLKDFQQKLRPQNGSLKSIALGDSHNDAAMLEAADIAVRILSPVSAPPALNKNNDVYTSSLYGPEGWNEMLNKILF